MKIKGNQNTRISTMFTVQSENTLTKNVCIKTLIIDSPHQFFYNIITFYNINHCVVLHDYIGSHNSISIIAPVIPIVAMS